MGTCGLDKIVAASATAMVAVVDSGSGAFGVTDTVVEGSASPFSGEWLQETTERAIKKYAERKLLVFIRIHL